MLCCEESVNHNPTTEGMMSQQFATLPKGCKPSKSASKDQTRPVLTHAELRQTTAIIDGERQPNGWELVTCDSYQLARVPLDVKDPNGASEPLTPGAINADALKAIEKAGGFYANGTVEPCNTYGTTTGQSFTRTEPGTFPQWDQLMPDVDEHAFTVGLNAELLYQLAQSLGAKDRNHCNVRLTFAVKDDGTPNPLRPILVDPMGGSGAHGLLMPVRVDA